MVTREVGCSFLQYYHLTGTECGLLRVFRIINFIKKVPNSLLLDLENWTCLRHPETERKAGPNKRFICLPILSLCGFYTFIGVCCGGQGRGCSRILGIEDTLQGAAAQVGKCALIQI